ncbi:hypothetical protein HYV12_02585 [Candidatus Dojkabacteria bacterium]|nr:hypothetical protein [Candidatus Dojkabacteria bacterium]
MKKFIANYKKYLIYLFLVWVFVAPYQIYLTSGISITLALLILPPIAILVTYHWFLTRDTSTSDLLKRYSLILILFFIVILSTLFNFESFNIKELIRWGLFFLELFLAFETVRITKIRRSSVAITFICSALLMVILTSYQIAVSQSVEYEISKGLWGNIFNDPELILEKVNGIGKFNWIYGSAVRVHGVFANVSHFAFLIGAALLLLVDTYRKKWTYTHTLVGAILMAFIVLSLVRTTYLAILMILVTSLIVGFRIKEKSIYLPILYSFVFGSLLALILGLFSYQQILMWSVLVRFIETVTFDGALFASQVESLREYFARVNLTSDGFNEYGGVGGRYNLWKITLLEVIIPRLKDVGFWLFGLGPSSIGIHLKETVNEYFSRFNSVDNSYLQWIVELGILPFLTLAIYIKKYVKIVLTFVLRNWALLFFILFNAMFTNILPDIRVSMIIVILISIMSITNEQYKD